MRSLSPSRSIIALVATCGRFDVLSRVSLPSISRQSLKPEHVIVVTDGFRATSDQIAHWSEVLGSLRLDVVENCRLRGVAGAWNTGLALLKAKGFKGYVAILDDDDCWDEFHLSVCLQTAIRDQVEVVVSGLRFVRDGVPQPRVLPTQLAVSDFLQGNPGWQGSNTFMSLDAFVRVGGFRDGLSSLNDRDLAIRVLDHPDLQIGFTGLWTATWIMDSTRKTLSSLGSSAKLQGLRVFWHLYQDKMTRNDGQAFFERAWRLFGISQDEITTCDESLFRPMSSHGDLI
jgi:hypothetical protein